MPITIRKVSEGRYIGTATPPDVREEWSTVTPSASDGLIEKLLSLGADPIEIVIAFEEADPEWAKNKEW